MQLKIINNFVECNANNYNNCHNQVVKMNNHIFENNLSLLKNTDNIMSDIIFLVNIHKSNITKIIDQTKNSEYMNNNILCELDNYVDLFLNKLYEKITSDKNLLVNSESQHYCDYSDSSLTLTSNNEIRNKFEYQSTSALFGDIPFKYNNLIQIISIAVNHGIQIEVLFENKELSIKYKYKNDDNREININLLWSGNIIGKSSCIDEMSNSSSASDSCSQKDYIEKLKAEIKNLNRLLSILSMSKDRIHNNFIRFKQCYNKVIAN